MLPLDTEFKMFHGDVSRDDVIRAFETMIRRRDQLYGKKPKEQFTFTNDATVVVAKATWTRRGYFVILNKTPKAVVDWFVQNHASDQTSLSVYHPGKEGLVATCEHRRDCHSGAGDCLLPDKYQQTHREQLAIDWKKSGYTHERKKLTFVTTTTHALYDIEETKMYIHKHDEFMAAIQDELMARAFESWSRVLSEDELQLLRERWCCAVYDM
jgi:hypothetical protein